MRKLMTLSFAAIGAAALIATANLPSAMAGGLNVVSEYPSPFIDEDRHPVPAHLADAETLAAREGRLIGKKYGRQVAGSVPLTAAARPLARDCIANYSDGEPTGPMPAACF